MASEAFERKLLKALEERDLDGVMRLVDPAIVCSDGTDYETLKVKLGAFFEQVPSLEVRLLDRVAVDGQVELKTQVAFEMGSAEAPESTVLFFLIGKLEKGYWITDIYDEGRSQQKQSPLYRPGFNWSGLSARILDLVEQRSGVWAGEHIEVVRTRTMEIRFERDAGSPAGVWARFSLLRYSETGLEQSVRALVYANSATRTLKVHARNLAGFGDDEPYMVDAELAEHVTAHHHRLIPGEATTFVLEREGGERECLPGPGQIEVFDAEGSLLYGLERVEKLEIVEEKPEHPKLSRSTVGKALRSWQMGTSLHGVDGGLKRVLIGTRHRDYIFEVRKDFSYCRSARYETCDRGMVSQMDVRLMVNPGEFTSFMPEDLQQRIRERIEFDESLFDPAICVTNENTFYWSVESASDDLIKLHGCQGAIYWYDRPLTRLSRVEWFQ